MNDPNVNTVEGLIALLAAQQALLAAVATSGTPINSVDAEYKQRRQTLSRGLSRLGLDDPFPWRGLWDWYGRWSSGDLPSYASRRRYVAELAATVEDQLMRRRDSSSVVDWGSSKTRGCRWKRVSMDSRRELDAATELDDLQNVGRRAREIIIDTANLVFKDDMVREGTDPPKGSDAKQRIELFLDSRASGSSHVELRRLIRAAWDLANSTTHSGGIHRLDAFAAAQATVVVVRCLQEIEKSGDRD